MTDGLTYSVCCQSQNRIGYSGVSQCLEFQAGTVPCRPTGVKTTNSYDVEHVAITWDQYTPQCTGGWPITGCTVAVRGYMYDDFEAERAFASGNPFFEDNRGFQDITHHCGEVIYNSGVQEYYRDANGDVIPVTNWNDVPRYYLLPDG